MTRRVDVLKNRLENEEELKGWYEVLKSRIEVLPRSYSTTNRPGRLSKSGLLKKVKSDNIGGKLFSWRLKRWAQARLFL